MTAEDGFLSRQELLAGLPAQRASTTLYAIEGRTTQLVSHARHEAEFYITPAAAEWREREFLKAIAAGRGLPLQLTIQDLERYAPAWASLVLDDINVRAAIAHLLAEKYRFTERAVPKLRGALGLDNPPVQEAYQRLYRQPLNAIYAPVLPLSQRLRWGWSTLSGRIEGLPPFWIAFLLTLPGAPGLLALPIVLAPLGPILSLALVVFFGLINMLTVAALAETVSRSGTARFGLGFLGQLVQEYLGSAGSVLLTVVLFINNFFVLIIFYIGVSGTLESSTHLPTVLWIVVLFGVCLYFLSRKSLNSTVTSALLVVFISLLCLLVIPLLVLPHFQLANLTSGRLSLSSGGSFNPAALGPVIGVMLSTFFSHFLVASYGPVVLRRDPSARSWIWGCISAIFVFMLIACLWIVAINGAIPQVVLANTVGTVLVPLEKITGPGVGLVGSILVILSLGLSSIQVSLGIYYLVQERLPPPASSSILRSELSRFLLSISPVIVAFLLAEWLSLSGTGSFSNLLGIVSAFSLPLLAGIVPVLLLAATRHKGDFVPGVVYKLLGNPLVLAFTFLFFLSTIFLHGLWIWSEPVSRFLVVIYGLIVLGVTIAMLRGGALNGRLAIEIRQDQSLGGASLYQATADGLPASGEAHLFFSDGKQDLAAGRGEIPHFPALLRARFIIPANGVSELKVWVHRITAELRSESLAASLVVSSDGEQRTFDLQHSGGQVILPYGKAHGEIEITLHNENSQSL
jgi:amino acid permease